MTHQELLDGYVDAKLDAIAQYSFNFDRDARELRKVARAYATEYGLVITDEQFDAYILEPLDG